jgi:hypothetical protein
MKLWYVSRDVKRYVYTDPRTGATELTQKRGEEIGERLIKQPEIQQVELADQLGLIHWWRRKEQPSRHRSQKSTKAPGMAAGAFCRETSSPGYLVPPHAERRAERPSP